MSSYKPGAGNSMSDLTIKLLEAWKCAGSVVNMVSVVTPSNQSRISIHSGVGRALRWSDCRHHVEKVILGNVFDALGIETCYPVCL